MAHATNLLCILSASDSLGYGPLGRTQMVKINYLLDLLRPLHRRWRAGYEFVKYHYGPYARAIAWDLELLHIHGLLHLKDFEKRPGRIAAT